MYVLRCYLNEGTEFAHVISSGREFHKKRMFCLVNQYNVFLEFHFHCFPPGLSDQGLVTVTAHHSGDVAQHFVVVLQHLQHIVSGRLGN